MKDGITCTVDPVTENLILTLDPEYREEWAERLEAVGEDNALWEATEGYWTNGSFEPFNAGDANPFVGLSSAPCIAECMDYDEDARKTVYGRFWFFADYMIRSYGEELRDTGKTVFHLAR